MNNIVTQAIVLSRTDFGEADRILTLITPDQGKISLMAKGVRRAKSKLAGGIELFSVSDITFVRGRGGMGTLLSSRLKHYYKSIVTDLDRTMLGYELMKQLNRNVEDEVEGEYFDLLQQTFQTLDDENMPTELAQLWFQTQLLRLDGKVPNLHTDVSGEQLKLTQQYTFSYDQMTFEQDENGMFDASHIKFLRLSFSQTSPKILSQITALEAMLQACTPLVKNMAAW